MDTIKVRNRVTRSACEAIVDMIGSTTAISLLPVSTMLQVL
jgi:hypothetical protein